MEPLGKEHDILKPQRSWGRGLHSVGFLLQASCFGFSFVVGLGFRVLWFRVRRFRGIFRTGWRPGRTGELKFEGCNAP